MTLSLLLDFCLHLNSEYIINNYEHAETDRLLFRAWADKAAERGIFFADKSNENCPWNRCLFCHLYKGKKFELRPVDDILRDIKTAKTIKDEITELSWKTGEGSRVREVAGLFIINISMTRHYAMFPYGCGGE